MFLNEGRSPELIQEYFNLLKWHKAGGLVKFPPESIKTDSALFEINNRLASIEKLILSLAQAVTKKDNLWHQLNHQLYELESELQQQESQLRELNNQWHQREDQLCQLEHQSYQPSRLNPSHILSRLPFREIAKRLFREVRSDIYHCFTKKPIIAIILVIDLISFILGCYLGSSFSFLAVDAATILLFIVLTAYIGIKINYIFKEYKKAERIELQREAEQEFSVSRQRTRVHLQTEQQDINAEKQRVELLKQEVEADRQRVEVDRQRVEVDRQRVEQNLFRFRGEREWAVNERQRQFDYLRNERQRLLYSRLQNLEERIEKWLREDETKLIEKAQKKLNIRGKEERYNSRFNALKTSPIHELIGITFREAERSVAVETDRDVSLKHKQGVKAELLINEEDFQAEIGCDRKKRYGVYEFLVIFLCDSFLSYHRCYWNFIKENSVDEESCEYLYDSIVSVKNQERSSLRLKDEEQKRTYRELLSLTTMDGKIVSFRISTNKIKRRDSLHPSKISEIEKAAIVIRQILRQRRIKPYKD